MMIPMILMGRKLLRARARITSRFGAPKATLLVCTIFLWGCDRYGGIFSRESVQIMYAIDAVKLISPDITTGDHPRTYAQSSYALSPSRRILLRREDLLSFENSIDTSKKIAVELSFAETISDPRVRLCPVTRSWMMLATWTVAHPFGTSGKWQSVGGDWDAQGCVEGKDGKDGKTVTFDMTSWFVLQVRARSTNHGLIVCSDDELSLIGETAATGYPKLLFSRF